MKGSFTIFLLLVSSILLGQSECPDIIIQNSISTDQVLDGFTRTDGFGGYHISFESDSIFKITNFSCTGSQVIDSGKWTIEHGNILVFPCTKQTMKFEMAKFDNGYYLFLPGEKEKFIKNVQTYWKTFSIDKDKQLSKKRINYGLKYILSKKYYHQKIKIRTAAYNIALPQFGRTVIFSALSLYQSSSSA